MRIAKINGFDNYFVDLDGVVYSSFSGKLKPRKTYITKNGYEIIKLSKAGKYKRMLIHRLVAEYFCLNKEKKEEVNHKDGNKLNNKYSNLEWVSHTENMKHAFKNKLIYRDIKTSVEFDGYIFRFDSIKKTAKCLSCSTSAIHNAHKKNKLLFNKYKITINGKS